MKNVIKHLKKGILMVTMFATLLSFANESSIFFIKNDAEKTALTIRDVVEGNLLSIKNNNGITLFKESVEKSGTYSNLFDLTTLPDGSYFFELDKDVEIVTIPFKVKSNKVVFDKDNEKTIFKPVTRVVGNLLYISKLSINEAPLEISIYFNDPNSFDYTERVYSESVKNTQVIERVFKLTGLNKGSYKVVFKSQGREFVKTIDKNPNS